MIPLRGSLSAASVQCQVSSNASIWAALALPRGPLNSTL
jgi:hypothetical protein